VRKNIASQVVGAQLNSKTDGSAVTTGTTTAYVLGDGGTQAAGSVGSGACTHEGNGFWTYVPAQAETNYDHVAFTFVNTAAVNATVQIYPSFPQTGDSFARIGAPAGASIAADAAAIKAVLPAALVSGRIDSSVGAMAANVLTASAINADAITDAKVASDVTIASVTGAVGSVTGNVGGNVVGSVASVTSGITVTTNNDKTGYGLSAAAVQAIWDALTSALTTVGSVGKLLVTNVDALISSRTKPADTQAAVTLVATTTNVTNDVGITQAGADKVWATTVRSLTTFGTLVADVATAVWGAATRVLTAGTNIVLAKGTGVTGFNDIAAGAAMTLTSGERTAIANEVETQIIDEADAEKVLTAITDKIASVNPSLGSLTVAAIASATATQITTDHGAGSYIRNTEPLDAAGTRTAVGLASANLDTTFAAIPTASANADQVWDEVLSGHLTAGSTGNALNAAGSAGDPWSTSLPGAYGAGTAGKIIGDKIVASIATGGISASSFAAGAINAAAIATDAIDADAIKTDAVTEIKAGLSTLTQGDIDAALMVALGGLGMPTAAQNATAVWASVARTLTAGTNIVLAKGVGVTGFNDLSAAQVNTEADTALTDAGVTPTVMGRLDLAVSTRLATTGYAAPLDAAGTRAAVGLASANLDAQLDALPTNAELATALGTADDAVLAQVALVKAKTDNLPSDPADQSLIIDATNAIMTRLGVPVTSVSADLAALVGAMLNTAMTESYAATGAPMTLAQAVHMVWSMLNDKAIVGTTLTTNKLDGVTPAMSFTLDIVPPPGNPTSQVRAT
jgi:hypothetical protein